MRRRLLALLLGLCVFPLCELACVIGGWGVPDASEDSFVGFSAFQPLFVKDLDGQRFRIPEARRKFFVEDSFSATKAPGTIRIFVLGGSTVQGNPFSIETAFPAWLQLALSAAQPATRWEVVNCGGISYASYRLVPILIECRQYEPDLIVFCEGHNEFLEDRTYAELRDQPAGLAGPVRWLSRFRTVQVARELMRRAGSVEAAPRQASGKPTLTADVDAILDYHNGTLAYYRDDTWRAGVVEHFRFNLDRLARVAARGVDQRGPAVPLMLVLPPSNLADMPPFKSEARTDLSDTDRKRLSDLEDALVRLPPSQTAECIACLEEARDIDPRNAGLRYRLGRFYEVVGRCADARIEFIAARDEDVCPLRIITPLEDTLRDTAQRWHLPLVDAAAVLEARTQHGLLDGSVLVDHVHPSFDGHQEIALAIAREMSRSGFVTLSDGWEPRARQAFQRHFDALPPVYFARGQQTLFRHNEWARGRAAGPDVETRFPDRVR